MMHRRAAVVGAFGDDQCMPGTVRPVADERDGLTAFLNQQRLVLRTAAFGLTDEQARSSPTVSSLSVGGLIKHVAFTERQWVGYVSRRPHATGPEAYAEAFWMAEGETLQGVLDDYAATARETDAAFADLALDHPVPVPRHAPWFPKDVDAWSLRWVLLHLIQDTARHAGHADLIRESIDGATAFPLLAAAEQWPVTPWMQPWRPPP
jgi:uncharacterized damage-inducible protein DinB